MPLSDTEVRKLQQHAPPQLREAEVVDPPLTPEGFIRVEVDGQRGDVKECPWVTRFSGVPVKGDAAAVIESDGGNFWALWWPQNGQEPSEGGGGGDEWFLFAGAPDPAQGTVGDLALSSTGSYYEKTDASTWTLRGSLLGPPGADGTDGTDGTPGTPGAPGESAYELAVANGFVGTEEDWLASLEGPSGPPGAGVEDLDPVIAEASRNVAYTMPGTGYVLLPFNVEDVDSDGFWNGTRFQPTRPGYYHLRASTYVTGVAANEGAWIYLFKNAVPGAAYAIPTSYKLLAEDGKIAPIATSHDLNASAVEYFNGTTDFAEVWVYAVANRVLAIANTVFEAASVSVAGPEGPPWVPTEYTLDTWHEIGTFGSTLATGGAGGNWALTDMGAGYGRGSFRKFPDGKVKLRGNVKATNFVASDPMFTLPVGYRPPANMIFTARASGASAGQEVANRIDVMSDGRVIMVSGGSANPQGWVSLENIEFDTETVTAMLAGPIGPEGPPWLPEDYTMEPWREVGAAGQPAFGSGWSNWSPGTVTTAGFRKDPTGRVWLKGQVQTTNTSTPIFILPVGYRPTVRHDFDHYGATAQLTFRVDPTGEVYIAGITATGASGARVTLDGHSFDTDTVTQMLAGPKGDPGPPWLPEEYTLDTWHKVGDGATGLGSAFGGSGHWVHYSATDPTLPDVAFRKAPDGKVTLRGMALRQLTTAGAGDIVITGIPAAYRPTRTVIRTISMSGTSTLLRVDVKTDGTVVLQTGGAVASGQWLSLEIEWDSDTVTQMLAGPRGPAGGVVGAPPVVTSLPTSPQDGEEVYYLFQQDVYPVAADWLTWHLRYDNDAGGWLPVGRVEPIFANQPVESTTAISANVWQQFNAGIDAEFAFPLGGDYLIEWGAGRFWITASGNWYIACFSTLSEQTNNGTQPNSDIACPPGVGTYSNGHASKRVTGVSAGQRQKLKYYSTAAGTLYASARYIRVYPRKLNAS